MVRTARECKRCRQELPAVLLIFYAITVLFALCFYCRWCERNLDLWRLTQQERLRRLDRQDLNLRPVYDIGMLGSGSTYTTEPVARTTTR